MLLLDTHVLLWWLQDSRKLGTQARDADFEHLRLVTGDAVLSGYDVPTLDART